MILVLKTFLFGFLGVDEDVGCCCCEPGNIFSYFYEKLSCR